MWIEETFKKRENSADEFLFALKLCAFPLLGMYIPILHNTVSLLFQSLSQTQNYFIRTTPSPEAFSIALMLRLVYTAIKHQADDSR